LNKPLRNTNLENKIEILFKTTYDSGTRSALKIGIVSAVSTAYINSIAKKKNTSRKIIQKLFRGGPRK
jgi:hypothetical protein